MITTDSFGNTYWNKFIKQLSAQNYCYNNNQITSDWTNIASFFEDIFTTRFTAGATASLPSGFTLDSVFEEKTTSTGTDYTGNRFIIKGSGESSGVGISSDAQLISPSVSIAANNIFNDTSATKSTIISARADCVVGFIFDNIPPASLDCKGFIAFGWLVDALYPDDNITGYGNAFFIIGDGTNIEAFHVDQKNGSVKKAILTSGAANFTFESVYAGVTIPTDAATNLVLIDATTSQMLGSVPSNLLLGRGNITLGQLYTLPSLGQGMANSPVNTQYPNFLAATNWGTGKLMARVASSGIVRVDPYFDNVVLFLKGDGTNNSTTIIDSSPNPKTITRFGDTKISTAQSKYGGSSIYFDGSGDYLIAPTTISLSIATVEFYVYFNSVSTVHTICHFNNSGGSSGLHIYKANQALKVDNGVNVDYTSGNVFALNQWHHVALVFQNTTLRIFVDGILLNTRTTQSYGTPNQIQVGRFYNSTGMADFSGYIDSFRYTQGVARYTTNFNPETDTYLAY